MPREAVSALLTAVRRRRMQLDIAEAIAWGLTGAVVASLSGRMIVSVVAAIAIVAARLWTLRAGWTLAHAARTIERAHANCHNLVITAEELHRHPERASNWMAARVASQAAAATLGIRVGAVVRVSRALVLSAAAAFGAIGIVAISRSADDPSIVVDSARSLVDRVLGREDTRLSVTIHPPAYARLAETRLTNPDRIEALEGSRLVFSSSAERRVRFGDRSIGTVREGTPVTATAHENGYFALEAADGSAPRRLIAFVVLRDAAPTVRIEQPAKDLLLPNAERTIPLRIVAVDDNELASLELRYTRMSGGGETFEFQEGALPLRVGRVSGREWRADGALALSTLKLQPGESLIYRAIARDRRPNQQGAGESDTYFVEIAGPGQIALEGVDMPPQEERYALSQQMIVLKIERLKARQPAMTREALAEEAALLAAEQRTVRANFVFLLGGHVEDEEVEAEQSHEIAEGRLQNTARREINRAIGDMTRAEQGLVAADTSVALPAAKSAVQALQRAFGKSRYLLRTLPSRSRIDPSRRMTGNLATAHNWGRAVTAGPARPGERARRLLTDLMRVSRQIGSAGPIAPVDFEQLAEQALQVDPTAAVWQSVARDILALRTADLRRADTRTQIDALAGRVGSEAAKGLIPQTPLARPPSAIERAWDKGGWR